MPVIIPAGFGVLAMHTLTTGDSEEMVWTCGVDLTGSAPDSDVPEAASTAWEDNLASITSSIVELVRVRLKVGPNDVGPTFEWAGSIPGSDSQALLPPNCAVLIHKHTALGGRANQGRAYLPGVSEISASLDSGGNFSSGTASIITTAIDGFWQQMADLVVPGPVLPVILHSGPAAPTPVINFTTSTKIATQRRRLRP